MTQTFIPRYSPQPIDSYSKMAGGVHIGPAFSGLLKSDAEAWNLAYLSHPYERAPEPADPQFTTLVRRTVNMPRRGPELDVAGARPPEETVRGLLRLVPEEFWFAFMEDDLAKRTPLFAAYGEAWLLRVMSRALAPWTPAEHESGLDVSQAAHILSKFTDAHI